MTAALASIPAGTGTQTRNIYASSWLGIDNTGATDSRAGFLTFLAACSGTGLTGVVDCPIKLVIGTDYTKPIFIRSGNNLACTLGGELRIDNSFIMGFVFHHSTDVWWRDVTIQYVGVGCPLDPTVAPYGNGTVPTIDGQQNDITMKNDLIANFGNSFSGSGSSLYTGRVNAQAILMIKGQAQRVRFDNLRVYTAVGANASVFAPVVVACDAQWLPNTVVSNNNQAVTATTACIAQDIDFNSPRFDGFYMGFVGGGCIKISNSKYWRYSDLQDSSGNNPGGAGPLGQWFAPPHAIYLSDTDPSFPIAMREITNGYDYGMYVGGATRRSAGSGSLLSLKISPTQNTIVDGWTSLRPDGCMDILTNVSGNAFGTIRNICGVYDSRTLTSNGGSVWGIRFPSQTPYNFMVLENISMRDVNPSPVSFPIASMTNAANTNCCIRGLKIYLQDWTGTGYPGMGLSGQNMTLDADYYFNVYSAEQTFRGSICNQGTELITNSYVDLRLYGYRLFPIAFTAPPSGTSATLSANWGHSSGSYLVQFSSNEDRFVTLTNGAATATWTGAIVGLATTAASGTGSTATISYIGQGPAALVGSSVVVSGVTPTGFNGTFTVTASTTGSVSYANTTVGPQTVAGTILPFTVATAQNALANNYGGYRQRLLNIAGGRAIGNRIRIMDVTNGLETLVTNGVAHDTWSQQCTVTPTGATFDLPLSIPSTHFITEVSMNIVTSLGTGNGLTTVGLGWSGSPTALLAAQAITSGTNPATPFAGSIAGSNGKTLRFTPTAGTFDGTGVVLVSVTCESIYGAG